MRTSLAELGLPTIFWDAEDLPCLPAELPLELHGSWEDYVDEREGDPALSRDLRRYSEGLADDSDVSPPGVRREQLLRSMCRWVNSGVPAVALAESAGEFHAVNVVGWVRFCDVPEEQRPPLPAPMGDEGVVLVVCDDQSGPYELVGDVLTDKRGLWYALILPALERIELSGEAAEERAFAHVRASATIARDAVSAGLLPGAGDEDLAAIAPHVEQLRGPVSVRVQLVEGRVLKAAILEQGREHEAARIYRLARLPKWVWIAEFQDRELRATGEPCVIAEVVLDPTSPDDVPITLLSSTLRTTKDAARLRKGEQTPDATGGGPGRPWRRLREITRGEPGMPRLASDSGESVADTRAAV